MWVLLAEVINVDLERVRVKRGLSRDEIVEIPLIVLKLELHLGAIN